MDPLMTRSVPDGAAMLESELIMSKPDGFIVGGSVKAFVAARAPTANGMSVSMIERSLPSDYGSCSLPYSTQSNVTTVTVDGSRSPLRFIDDKPSLPKSLAINKPQIPEKKPALLKAVASGLRRSESMKETGSTPVSTGSTSTSKNIPRRPPKAKYSLPAEVNDETKYYSLPRRGKSGSSSIKRSNSNCSLKSVDGGAKRVDDAQQVQQPSSKPSRQLPQPPTATATLDPKKLRPPRASPPDSASLSRSPKKSPPIDNPRRLERVSSTASISGTSIYATLPRNKAKPKVKAHSPERSESGRESAASTVSTVSTVAAAPKPPPKPVHLTPVVGRKEITKSGTLPRNMGRMKKAESEGRSSTVVQMAPPVTAKSRSASTPRTATNRVQSPGLRNRKEATSSAGMTSKSPSPATTASKPPRPVIYMENATQTLLTLEDIQAALVRASTPSSCTLCDSSVETDQPKSITIEKPAEEPSEKTDVWSKTCDVGVQAEINFYDPNKAYTVADTQNLLRQLRKLTEEHSKLEANYARLRSAVGEVDRLKTELRKMQATLEEEVAIKNEVQQELDQTSSRVQSMLSSLEGVEKEFTTRGNSLADLEAQLELAQRTMLNQQMEIETSQNIIYSLQQDLEKSISTQKTLFQQLQETESESRELQDFLQSEKNTLQDALREAEKTMLLLRSQLDEKERLLHDQTLRCNRLMQLSSVEERRMCSSPFEERGVGDGIDGDQDSVSVTSSAKEMLLHQGAQLSSSAVALENLSFKITALQNVVSDKKDLKQKQEDWQAALMCDLLKKMVGSEEYEALMETSNGPSVSKNKRQKQPLLFDDENGELDDDLNSSKCSTLNSSSGNMLESVIEEDEEMANGDDEMDASTKLDQPEPKVNSTVDSGRSLSEQVTQIDGMLSEFLKCVLTIGASIQRSSAQQREEREELLAMCQAKDRELATLRCAVNAAAGANKAAGFVNGTSSPNAIDKKTLDGPCSDKPDPFVLAMKSEMSRMKLKLLEKDAEMREKEERHARHAQILLENWRRAEAELSRLDDAMDRVVLTLQSVPEVVTSCPALKKLLIELGSLNCGIPFKSPAINGAGPSSSPINGKKHSSSSNGTLLEADELETVID